jgi:hypothetical protein
MLDDLFAPAVPLSAPFILMVLAWGCVLPTREEPVWQRHLVSVFLLGAHGPDHGCDSDEDSAQDGRVGFPVGGLRIPATGGRPDVLGVPGQSEAASLSNWVSFLRDLSSSSHCEVLFGGDGGGCIVKLRSEVVPPLS